MLHFVKGVIVGFSVAAPVGPIGLLCIRRAIADGRLAGFVSGLGAATADGFCGAIAVLGLSAVSQTLITHESWLRLGGGLFLLFLGITTARSPATTTARSDSTTNLFTAYFSIFVLTAINPITILSFIGIFAGAGLGDSMHGWAAFWLVLGIFSGSGGWWLFMSSAAGWFGSRLTPNTLRWINIASGLGIALFGVWQLALLLRSLR